MPEQPQAPYGQQPEDVPSQQPSEQPIVKGEVDPTSIPGNPQFVDRQTFLSSLSANAEPEREVNQRFYPNTGVLRARAAYEESLALNGIIGFGVAAASLTIVEFIQNQGPDAVTEKFAAVAEPMGWIVLYVSGAIATASTVLATIYRGRAAEVDAEINSFLDGSPSLKPSKKPKPED